MRMNIRLKRGLLTLATLLWMGQIYGFSADTAEQSSGLSAMVCSFIAGIFIRGFDAMSPAEQEAVTESMQIFVRKGAHVTEYAILDILLLLTFASYGLKRAGALALTAGLLYAALDEYHQRFVPGRSGQVKDVLIDACGLLLGLAAVRGAGRFIQIIKEKKKYRAADAGPKA